MKIAMLWVSAFLSLFLSFSALGADLSQSLQSLPVQDGGRLKPFDSFARESLQLIYGKQEFKVEGGPGAPRPATEIIMTWILQPTAWQDTPLFEVKYGLLKKALKLPEEKKYLSFNELSSNERLPTVMQELQSKRETKEKLDPYFQSLQRLENQIYTFREIAAGNLVRIVPPRPGNQTQDKWLALSELPPALQEKFVEVTKAFIQVLGVTTSETPIEKSKEIETQLGAAVSAFKELAKAENPELYPSDTQMGTELHYNHFHPFKWAWIVYLLAAISCFLAWILGKHIFYTFAWELVILGFLIHIYGFGLRVYLTGRPPVSNMYETVVWVAFGAVLFSMIIESMYRWRFILLAGALVGAFCLALADMAPLILDPSLQPLEPVLRNNFWLLIHVLTITISYAAFFLAFALGDIGLIYYLKGEEKNKEKIKAITLAIYRAIQIGVALLLPGIILGGVWADYSWGRFWGWDPKETWALIVLLGYIALLHARLVGLLKDFGIIASAVVSFTTVIMAWYGVNFILGAGLHSYGFGAGGVEYVAVFVAIHLLFVVFTSVIRFGRLKKTGV
jgi:cytochrome c-type biogenesis protein CcsB